MKLIENSFDQLQVEITLDNMASCDVVTDKSVQSQKENATGNGVLLKKDADVPKLSNGFCTSPLRTNGFIEDLCDEDFQLVFEASSEEGSPKKKSINDEDTISAPQLVQEIENILGKT